MTDDATDDLATSVRSLVSDEAAVVYTALLEGRLGGAPVFARTAFLITNDAAAANWPWLPELIEALSN